MAVIDQLRSVIEWKDPDPELVFYKWTDHGDEIKNASKLIVGPGQGCIFVYEGKLAATYDQESKVDLKTDNVPFWTTVKSLLQRMESEHKVGIYYFRRAEIVNVRWGTPAPIKYLDPVFRFPVGLGAYGNFSCRIQKPEDFFSNIVAGAESYAVSDLQRLVLSRITPLIADILAKSKHSYVEVDANRKEISAAALADVQPVLEKLGFQLTDFRIEGTQFDEDTQRRIGRIADLAAEGQAAAAAGVNFSELTKLEAMKEAAKQPNTVAGQAMGMGVGLGFGQVMGAAVTQPQAPVPAADDMEAKFHKLKKLFDSGFITEAEFAAKKKELLEKL
jgi:membrane protease subunit (stomatin/prohibitin family)